MKINLPSSVTIVLALIAGVVSVLLQGAFDLDLAWVTGLTVLLVFLSGVGIGPLTGDQFVAALHLPPSITVALASLLSAAALAVTQIHDATTVKILAGVITFLSALGFGPRVSLDKAKSIVRTATA